MGKVIPSKKQKKISSIFGKGITFPVSQALFIVLLKIMTFLESLKTGETLCIHLYLFAFNVRSEKLKWIF